VLDSLIVGVRRVSQVPASESFRSNLPNLQKAAAAEQTMGCWSAGLVASQLDGQATGSQGFWCACSITHKVELLHLHISAATKQPMEGTHMQSFAPTNSHTTWTTLDTTVKKPSSSATQLLPQYSISIKHTFAVGQELLAFGIKSHAGYIHFVRRRHNTLGPTCLTTCK
jgi:hypothetical protein